jgi:hypothetical protein
MRSGYHNIAVMTSGHQAILQPRGAAELLDQKKTTHQQQQDNSDADKALGLALGDLVFGILIQPMVMSIHRILPSGCLPFNLLGTGMKERQEVATPGMFR